MAEDFVSRLQRVEQAIGALRGSLPVGLRGDRRELNA